MPWLEVESKIKLSNSEVNEMRNKIKSIAVLKHKEKKEDNYFAIRNDKEYPKKAFRIRASKGKFEINFKKWLTKFWTKEIVVKQEFEFKLENKDQLENLIELFRDLGFKEWIKKIKLNETYQYKKDKKASIEINNVQGLGYFIEIEYLCQLRELNKAKNTIHRIIKDLGIKENQIDNTGYTRMLWRK